MSVNDHGEVIEDTNYDWCESRWTFGAFDDGSSMWLTEWKNYRTYRCHGDDGATSEWFDSIKDFNCVWQDELSYVDSKMASAILKRWNLLKLKNRGDYV